MDAMLSESKLRMIAESRGYPVNHKQFVAYREAGLIPVADPMSKRWPPETVDQLVRIRELGRSVRSLARRVLLLKPEFAFHGLESGTVLRAMEAVIPTIERPMHKLQRVADASRLIEGGDVAQAVVNGDRTRLIDLPPFESWMGLLERSDRDVFTTWLSSVYLVVGIVLDLSQRWGWDLSDIPREELVVLLMIQKLAWRERMLHSSAYAH